MVAGLAFLGFCVIYMLRVNLSVAIVAMTANKNHTLENGTIVVVSNNQWTLTYFSKPFRASPIFSFKKLLTQFDVFMIYR